MKRIYLHIKGNAAQAATALDAHGIHPTDRLSGVTTHTGRDFVGSSVYVRVECEPGVIRWFCETSNADLVPGFGFPVGTLLHHATVEE